MVNTNIKKARFLVVDEVVSMRRVVTSVLKTMGIESIFESSNGRDAYSRFSSGDIDFVISEYNFPDESGLSLLKNIRENGPNKIAPIVFVTAETRKQNVMAAVQSGISGYLVKPFAPAMLQQKIETAWNRYVKQVQSGETPDNSAEANIPENINNMFP